MKHFLYCRRTFISTLSIVCLTGLGLYRGIDISMALATVAIGLAASNAAEGIGKSRPKYRTSEPQG